MRNAGARVTSDVLRTLVLASYLLGVDRRPDTRSLAFLVTSDQESTVRADVQRVQSWPYLTRLRVGGFLYDVDTGRLTQLC